MIYSGLAQLTNLYLCLGQLVVVLGGFGMNRFLQSEFRCHFQTPVAFAGEDG
jgi:hypothetical protein